MIRVHQLEVLEKFLGKTLDYKLYAEDFAEDLAETLEDNLPTDQADIAQQLAQACARNDWSLSIKSIRHLPNPLDMDDIFGPCAGPQGERACAKVRSA